MGTPNAKAMSAASNDSSRVAGRRSAMKRALVLLLAAACVGAPVAAQEADLTVVPPVPTEYQAKKTAWGEPDFRGGWPIDHLNGRTPLQRDVAHGNRAFLTEEEFVTRIEEGAFLEHVSFVGGRYGTLASEIDRIGAEGKVCILELEIEGALKVQAEVPHSVTIFIAADVPELERRLRARDTESSGEIGLRIELARHQLEQAHSFRYMVRNDDVERATEALAALVERELHRLARAYMRRERQGHTLQATALVNEVFL